MHNDSVAVDAAARSKPPLRERAVVVGGLSVLIPGVGQLLQGRTVPAALHFATVFTYVLAAMEKQTGVALALAVAWRVWSGVEAFMQAREWKFRPQPDED